MLISRIVINAGFGLRIHHYSAIEAFNKPTAPLVEQLGNVEVTEVCECEAKHRL